MITIKENQLNTEVYLSLRKAVNWKVLTKGQADKAIENCLYNVTAYVDNVPVGMGRIVGDGAVHQRTVGQGNSLVVGSAEHGVHDGDLLHGTGHALGLYVILNAEGLEDQQHQAACQVGQRALHCQTHCGTCGCQNGNHGSHGNAHHADGGDHDDHLQTDGYEVEEEGCYGTIHFGSHLAFAQELHESLHAGKANDQDQACKEKLCPYVNAKVHKGIQKVFHNFPPKILSAFILYASAGVCQEGSGDFLCRNLKFYSLLLDNL